MLKMNTSFSVSHWIQTALFSPNKIFMLSPTFFFFCPEGRSLSLQPLLLLWCPRLWKRGL